MLRHDVLPHFYNNRDIKFDSGAAVCVMRVRIRYKRNKKTRNRRAGVGSVIRSSIIVVVVVWKPEVAQMYSTVCKTIYH